MSHPLTVRVSGVHRETPTTRVVRVGLNGAPFDYCAGQSVLVGPHGHPARKAYSIACAPEEARRNGWIEFLIKMDAAGEHGTHLTGLRRGAYLDVEGPFGSFCFPADPAERRFLFVAGGTGIAPIRAMMRHAVAARCPGRLGLVYSARRPDELAFHREFHRLARSGAIEFLETVTRAAGLRWHGERGRIDLAQLAPFVEDAATLCFVCGPVALVEDVPRLLRQLGVAPGRIRVEQW